MNAKKRIPWQHLPGNEAKAAAMAANARKAKSSKIHWTRRPENKDRVIAIAKLANKGLQKKKGFGEFMEKAIAKKTNKTHVINYGESLSDQLKTLETNAKKRIQEIDTEVNKLQHEKQQLIRNFRLQDIATVDNIEGEDQ